MAETAFASVRSSASVPPFPAKIAAIRSAVTFVIVPLVPGVEPSRADRAAHLDLFLAYYTANIAATSHAYPGLEKALDSLAERGARLTVCTNKRAGMSEQLV